MFELKFAIAEQKSVSSQELALVNMDSGIYTSSVG